MQRFWFAALAVAVLAVIAGIITSPPSPINTAPSTPAATSTSPDAGASSATASVNSSAMCSNQPAALTTLKDADVTALKIEDAKVGSGSEAVAGKTVVVNYIGRLVDGKQFDSSCGRPDPFSFGLGQKQVISGWDQGVAGMKVGGIRRLIIPASLGYGAAGAGGVIPPNAALIFDVELMAVQ